MVEVATGKVKSLTMKTFLVAVSAGVHEIYESFVLSVHDLVVASYCRFEDLFVNVIMSMAIDDPAVKVPDSFHQADCVLGLVHRESRSPILLWGVFQLQQAG